MADSENGAAPAQAAAPVPVPGAREMTINAQYVKDLSFESPRAPHSLLQQQQQPEVALSIDVKAQTLAPSLYEVVLTINAEAKAANERVFIVELVYGAVTTLTNVPQEEVPRALLVEAPHLLFPFARAIVADATREGGFMPLLLRPIDFAELLRQQQRNAPAQPPGPVTA
jgi:preprotein translocase subunit SecB